MSGESEISAVMNISEKMTKLLTELLKFLGKGGWNISKNTVLGIYNHNENKAKRTDIGTGAVPIKDLVNNAKVLNDNVITQDGISKSEMDSIIKKAKEYSIPVAFTGKKESDNIKVSVRACDKSILEQIMTDIVKEKIQERPNDLTSFKVKKWEIEGLQAELNKHDLSASFVKDNEGEFHCIYEAKDKKAFDIVKNEFKKIHSEINNNLNISHEDGFIVIRDNLNEKEISFDTLLTKSELSEVLQENFGYEEIKANMAANKFGDTLSAKEQQVFLKNDPLMKIKNVEYNIKLENESILLNDFSFVKFNLKDGSPEQYVIMDKEGNAVMFSSNMNFKKPDELKELLDTRLGITDKGTVEAILDKAEKVRDIYKADLEQNFNEQINDKEKHIGTCDINRTSKNEFDIKFENKAQAYTYSKTFSFSNKKKAFDSIRYAFTKAGLSNSDAAKYAKNVISKASRQSIGKLFETEVQTQTQNALNEVKDKTTEQLINASDVKKGYSFHREVGGTFTINDGKKTERYDLNNKNEAVEKMKQDFGMSEEKADRIFGKVTEQSGIENQKTKQSSNTKSAPKTQQSQKTDIKNTTKRGKH